VQWSVCLRKPRLLCAGIRLGIPETPVFQRLVDQDKIEPAPIIEVIDKQWKEIILSDLLRMSEQAPFYIFTAFIFAYAVNALQMPRDFILTAVLAASCVSFVTIALSGHISGRIGRRKMYLIGAAAIGPFGFLTPQFCRPSSSPLCSRSFRTTSNMGCRRR
jgi:hypothetical protein